MSIKLVNANKAAEEIFRQAKEAQAKEDYEKALELFEKAAEMGYAPAYVETGNSTTVGATSSFGTGTGLYIGRGKAWKRAIPALCTFTDIFLSLGMA